MPAPPSGGEVQETATVRWRATAHEVYTECQNRTGSGARGTIEKCAKAVGRGKCERASDAIRRRSVEVRGRGRFGHDRGGRGAERTGAIRRARFRVRGLWLRRRG